MQHAKKCSVCNGTGQIIRLSSGAKKRDGSSFKAVLICSKCGGKGSVSVRDRKG